MSGQAHSMIGQRVGDYRIDRVLGEGGMGVVFRAVQERLGQVVALKMLHPSLVAEERLKSRFVREAQALARLQHPNVVRLLNFLNLDGNLFIVMEYMEGRAIDEILQETGPIPELRAAEYFVQVLAAMHYAHSLGIIHRDIKPPNLAVLENGGVKVLDFGTAKIIGEQRLTQEGMTLGTLIYMSPEQLCGRDLDHRSDIYSLGVTLYEMVTNHVPHYCEDEMALITDIVKGTPDPPTQHYPHLSREMERILLKSIEKDPAHRYQTADEFLKAINAYMAQRKKREPSKRQTPPSGRQAVPEELRRREPSRRSGRDGLHMGLLVAAIGALALCAAAGAALIAMASRPAAAAGVMGLGVAIALVLGALAFRRAAAGAPEEPAGPPAEVFGEATIALEGEAVPRSGGAPLAPPPPPPAVVLATLPDDGGDPNATERDLPLLLPEAIQAPAAYLYAMEGPDKGRSWALPYGAVTIGRGAHNTIALSDGGVSTTHAQIGYDGQRFVLTDLQSRNGSYINNRRVAVAGLSDRDVVHFGTSQFAFSQPAG